METEITVVTKRIVLFPQYQCVAVFYGEYPAMCV